MEVVIKNLFDKTITLDSNISILKNLQANGIDWLQSCGGKGRCTTCAMQVLEGTENLSPLTAFEQKETQTGRLRANERLACQCTAIDSVVVAVPERCKLPHLTYSC
jgi:2Fe-2S ferredoxin